MVGAGAAGWTVASELRRHGYDRRLTLIGAEVHPPYDRPPLSKQVLWGTWDATRVGLTQADELEALGADVRLGSAAVSYDPGRRLVTLSDGSELVADEVVAATGCTPRLLADTAGLAGVLVLRTLDDALRLQSALEATERLIVVGAGFLGLEVAAAARGMGVAVEVVSDLAPMIRPLGEVFSARLARLHEANGVNLHIGRGVDGWTVTDNRVTGVRTGDRTLPADLVLAAVGAVPDVAWLDRTGLDLAAGVPCDPYGRALPGLHAAGDVACWWYPRYGRRLRTEHRTNASEQAAVVARDIVGEPGDPYDGIPFWWTDQYDAKIQAYGLPGSDAEEVVLHRDGDEPTLVAYGRAGRLDGIVGWSNIRGTRQARQLVLDRASWPPDSSGLDLSPRRASQPTTGTARG